MWRSSPDVPASPQPSASEHGDTDASEHGDVGPANPNQRRKNGPGRDPDALADEQFEYRVAYSATPAGKKLQAAVPERHEDREGDSGYRGHDPVADTDRSIQHHEKQPGTRAGPHRRRDGESFDHRPL